jgi:hypothetical protein
MPALPKGEFAIAVLREISLEKNCSKDRIITSRAIKICNRLYYDYSSI